MPTIKYSASRSRSLARGQQEGGGGRWGILMTQIRFVFKIFSLTVNVLELTEGILLQLLRLGPQHRGHGGVRGAWKYEDYYNFSWKMRVLKESERAY